MFGKSLLVACLASAVAASAAPSRIGQSQLLRMRGGNVATSPGPSMLAAETPLVGKSAPTGLQLKVVNPTEGGTLITLPSSEFERLGMQPGSRVRVRKMKPAALWSSVPDQAIGEAVADPKLDAGVRLTVADMRMLQLRVGENVLVAPMPFVSVPSAAAATSVNSTATSNGQNELERYRQQRRRHGWMRAAMWMMYGFPRHGHGYGYGHEMRGYGGYPYTGHGGHRAYGGSGNGRGRRIGGRVGGRRR
jgi:hypothetical protein